MWTWTSKNAKSLILTFTREVDVDNSWRVELTMNFACGRPIKAEVVQNFIPVIKLHITSHNEAKCHHKNCTRISLSSLCATLNTNICVVLVSCLTPNIGYANLAIPKIYNTWYYHVLQLRKTEHFYFLCCTFRECIIDKYVTHFMKS